jgi:hypothetical protein
LRRRGGVTAGAGPTAQQIVVNYMAGMDFWQNILAMVLQFFIVSRIFKYFGIGHVRSAADRAGLQPVRIGAGARCDPSRQGD